MRSLLHSEKYTGVPAYLGKPRQIRNLESYLSKGWRYSERRKDEIRKQLKGAVSPQQISGKLMGAIFSKMKKELNR